MWWRVIDNFRGRKENEKYELQLSRAERTTFRRLIKYNPPKDAYAVIVRWRDTDAAEEEARRRSEFKAIFQAKLQEAQTEQSPAAR
jgi:hypothetical protein